MVLIEEGESFSMTARVKSPGFIRMVPTGGIVRRTSEGTYVAGLLPQMFLGASGEQLSSWRQWVGSTGSQTILSKPAGELLVPPSELYWRKVSEPVSEAQVARAGLAVPLAAVAIVGTIVVATVVLWFANKT